DRRQLRYRQFKRADTSPAQELRRRRRGQVPRPPCPNPHQPQRRKAAALRQRFCIEGREPRIVCSGSIARTCGRRPGIRTHRAAYLPPSWDYSSGADVIRGDWRIEVSPGGLSCFGGRASERRTDPNSTLATTSNDVVMGILYTPAISIFTPMKARTTPKPTLR